MTRENRGSLYIDFFLSLFFQTYSHSVFSHLANIFTISFILLKNSVIFYQFLIVIRRVFDSVL